MVAAFRPGLFSLQSVRIAQFREDFFSALSAPLRAPREKGNLVAVCRAAFFVVNPLLVAAGQFCARHDSAVSSSVGAFAGFP
ncbi:hypothetical protein SBA7_1330002 [Candidatus Sulfotelmatobacter sp. SbA7]|nr:hypothetical protein SBA7_1330002 [Candidatus Sulfotelmatobacter sp. SbA7]